MVHFYCNQQQILSCNNETQFTQLCSFSKVNGKPIKQTFSLWIQSIKSNIQALAHIMTAQCTHLCIRITWTNRFETVMKFEINISFCFAKELNKCSMNMRTTDSAAQESLAFLWPEMMRNAGAQQSCRYLTPLLSRAGENPIHFQLLYLLTVDPVSKHKGEGIQPNTHASSFHKTLGFNYLGGWYEGGRGSENGTKRLSRANVDLRNDLHSASERIPSWSGWSCSPQPVGSTDLETQQSLSVWVPTP